ncbi:MAG: baseplate J/gp47 family protein [Chloroflexi bacterium]|nr:baseplate J/gp47 family protein [Chloroflexota bacterium]
MTVCYLEVDDEITDAVARLRATDDRGFILFVPPGSRISTSRINFRLLAREGHERGVTVALVSGEPGVRSIAISAGMPAYATVDEAEAALAEAGLEGRRDPDATGGQDASQPQPVLMPSAATPAPHMDVPVAPVEPMVEQARRAAANPRDWGRQTHGTDLEKTRVLPRSTASAGSSGAMTGQRSAAAVGTAADPGAAARPPWTDQAPARGRPRSRRRSPIGLIVRLAIVAGIVGGALYGAYLYLPSVSISVRPHAEAVGPLTIRVVADPATAVPDPETGIIPAEQLDIPLSATDQFEATGVELVQTRATGRIRFTSENTLFEVPIPEGTRISTDAGIEFETTKSVTVPQASFQTGPASAQAAIRAVRPGPEGNVPAESITELPQPISAQLVTATNPDATTDGRRTETRIVTREDYDAAMVALTAQLEVQLAAALADPATTPRGLRIFPDTAVRDEVTASVAAGDLVDQPMEVFSLTGESRGTVLAVDEALIGEVAAERLAAELPATARLFEGSVTTTVGEGRVEGRKIVYDVSVEGEQYAPLAAADLVAAVRGKKISEARVILGAYGSVEITPWPDFIDTVPDDARRIDLTLLDPQRSNQ